MKPSENQTKMEYIKKEKYEKLRDMTKETLRINQSYRNEFMVKDAKIEVLERSIKNYKDALIEVSSKVPNNDENDDDDDDIFDQIGRIKAEQNPQEYANFLASATQQYYEPEQKFINDLLKRKI